MLPKPTGEELLVGMTLQLQKGHEEGSAQPGWAQPNPGVFRVPKAAPAQPGQSQLLQ